MLQLCNNLGTICNIKLTIDLHTYYPLKKNIAQIIWCLILIKY